MYLLASKTPSSSNICQPEKEVRIWPNIISIKEGRLENWEIFYHLFLVNILPFVIVFPILVKILRTILKMYVASIMSHISVCLLHLSQYIPYEVTCENLASLINIQLIHPLPLAFLE